MQFKKFVFLKCEEEPIWKEVLPFFFLLAWPQINKVTVNIFVW